MSSDARTAAHLQSTAGHRGKVTALTKTFHLSAFILKAGTSCSDAVLVLSRVHMFNVDRDAVIVIGRCGEIMDFCLKSNDADVALKWW